MAWSEIPNMSCAGCPVGAAAVYGPAFAGEPEAITNLRKLRRTFRPRQIVLRQGDIPAHVYTLYSGWAYAYRILSDGSRQVLGFYIPGDLLTLQAFLEEPLSHSVKALTTASVCGFERVGFFEYLQDDRALRESLCRAALQSSRINEEKLINVARRSALARLASFLIVVERRLRARGLAGADRYPFPIPQSVMADALGLTPVYLNRTLTALRNAGVVDLRDNEIVVRRPDLLKAAEAGEWQPGEARIAY